MKSLKQDNRGIIHHFALLGVVVGVVVVGAFVLVLHANSHKSTNASVAASNKSQLATSKTSNATNKNTASTVSNSSTAVTPPHTTVVQSPAKSTSTSSKTSTPTPTPTAPAPTPAAPSPLSVLTTLIANLQNGTAEAQVTATSVAVAGPISTAQARPIVFTANGQTYFAYTQGSAPNFNQSASAVAASMAITTGDTSGVSLTQAYLDKTGKLTSTDYQYVGYSTGGN